MRQPGCADPLGNDAPNQFVAQIAMVLKYSDKYPNIALRATGSTTHNKDVYASARQAFRLVREFYDGGDKPVMAQGTCPNSSLGYDRECPYNLRAAVDEGQAITILPCSLGVMTAPETIYIQVIYYELCKSLGIPCSISGCYGDGTKGIIRLE